MMPIKKYLPIIITLCLFMGVRPADASVAESNNYKLESDEINMGAVGEMSDFSGSDRQEAGLASAASQNPKQGSVVLSVNSHKISVWEMIFGSIGVSLFLIIN